MKGIIVKAKDGVVITGVDMIEVSDDLCQMVANGAVILPNTVDVVGVEMDDDMMCWAEEDADPIPIIIAKSSKPADCFSKEPSDEEGDARKEVAAFLRHIANERSEPEK